MTDDDKGINPLHFESDTADIRIQIWINLEIQIRILDHFWLRFRQNDWHWQKYAVSDCVLL